MTDNKCALVTGAGCRIGQAIALDLAAAGYRVAVHYNGSAEGAEETVAAIRDQGGEALAFQADFLSEDGAVTLMEQVTSAMGPVTLLVNNASLFEDDTWDTVSPESWDRHMTANLKAPFFLMQAFGKALGKDAAGAIVNIIDQRVWNLTPNYMSYTLAKSGLWTLTRTMALALAPKIRVNAVGPGPTLPNVRQVGDDFDEQWRHLPLQRKTDLADICQAVRYLAEAKSMTGQMIAVDGGEHLGWAQPECGFVPKE